MPNFSRQRVIIENVLINSNDNFNNKNGNSIKYTVQNNSAEWKFDLNLNT